MCEVVLSGLGSISFNNIFSLTCAFSLEQLWSNPFDVGCKANWQQVFGPQPFLLGLLPSRRAPPLPVMDFFPVDNDSRGLSDVSTLMVYTSVPQWYSREYLPQWSKHTEGEQGVLLQISCD